MDKRFGLEIYEPGSTTAVVAFFEWETAFGAIAHGDLIRVPNRASPLQVVSVEHVVMNDPDGGVQHKVAIITKEMVDTQETRFTREGPAPIAPSNPS
jgi:hypothetical protein